LIINLFIFVLCYEPIYYLVRNNTCRRSKKHWMRWCNVGDCPWRFGR